MGHAPTKQEMDALGDQMAQERSLPSKSEHNRVVYWHVFRRRDDAVGLAGNIRLNDGERLVGGHTRDSIGPLWWIGVEVENLAAWGNRGAVHKIDRVDPENPDSPLL